jgi:hypothetical protein
MISPMMLMRLVMTGVYLFPVPHPTMPRQSASETPDMYIVGLNPHRAFPASFLSWEGRKVYLDAEDAVEGIKGVERRRVPPDRVWWPRLYDTPLRRHRYEEWKEWKTTLDREDRTTFSEYVGLERSMTRQIHDLLVSHEKTMVFLPFYWIVPDASWHSLSESDRHQIRVLAPLLTETAVFPYGDEIYIEEDQIHGI